MLLSFLSTLVFTLYLFPTAQSFTPSFPYATQKVRGVNLGGWLVLESFITPTLFQNTGNSHVIDEWTFCSLQNRAVAQAALIKHWNTFITQADIAAIAAAGLNHVRIPIGYWAFDVGPGEPYIQGQLPYLVNAITWARNLGLKVVIDLHGAPGGQNPFDNSGHKIPYPLWQTNQTDIARTNAIIKRIASMFKNEQTVAMIQPLNEPAGYLGDIVLKPLHQFFFDSYGNIRYPFGTAQQGRAISFISDAFQDPSYWNGFQNPPTFQGVMLDTHVYQIFTDSGLRMTNQQHIQAACAAASKLSRSSHWITVGEWSTAKTDCAFQQSRALISRYAQSVGSCSGLSGKASTFSSSYKTFLRQFWEAQVQTFEKAGNGWMMWTWKLENADDWSYQAGLQNGWIPHNPTNYQYPHICG